MSSGHSGDPGSSASSAEGTAALVLIAGVVLAIGVLAFALVSTDDLARSIVTGLVFLYPAAAYAIDRDDDPTNILPPVPVTVAAGLVAGIVATLSFVSGTGPTLDRTLYALFLAATILLPAAAYATGYGDPPTRPAPWAIVVGGTTGGVVLLIATVASGVPGYGAGTALLAFVSGVGYAHSQGFEISRQIQRRMLSVSLLLAVGCLAIALSGYQPLGFVSVAIVTLLAPTGAVILTRS